MNPRLVALLGWIAAMWLLWSMPVQPKGQPYLRFGLARWLQVYPTDEDRLYNPPLTPAIAGRKRVRLGPFAVTMVLTVTITGALVYWGTTENQFSAGFRRFMRARQRGVCVKCGYPIRRSSSQRCPECGTPS
jgi:hypothetical protein